VCQVNFSSLLPRVDRRCGNFIQDKAKARTDNYLINELNEVFSDRVVSTGLRPPRFQDLHPCNFYFGEKLKGKLYVNESQTLDKLKDNFLVEITRITRESSVVLLDHF
jgi:hypothetical protein